MYVFMIYIIFHFLYVSLFSAITSTIIFASCDVWFALDQNEIYLTTFNEDLSVSNVISMYSLVLNKKHVK
jgi:hypothetical protein